VRITSEDPRRVAIVPAFNEEGSVDAVVRGIRDHAPGFDVVVVDDGSTDETAIRARAAGAAVVRHPFNLGIGGAVQSGYRYALRNGYELAVQVDGDGQHDPGQIAVLEAQFDDGDPPDMVWGSRFLEPVIYRMPLARRAGSRIFSSLLSLIVGQRITDPTSGFRMINRRGIELFARDYPHDYPEVEAILMLHAHRLSLREVAVTMRQRSRGVSSISAPFSAYYMARVLLAVMVGLFRRHPVPDPEETPVATVPSHGYSDAGRPGKMASE
jgi:glycosyltransferase involved in cell wall biosynthesis